MDGVFENAWKIACEFVILNNVGTTSLLDDKCGVRRDVPCGIDRSSRKSKHFSMALAMTWCNGPGKTMRGYLGNVRGVSKKLMFFNNAP